MYQSTHKRLRACVCCLRIKTSDLHDTSVTLFEQQERKGMFENDRIYREMICREWQRSGTKLEVKRGVKRNIITLTLVWLDPQVGEGPSQWSRRGLAG